MLLIEPQTGNILDANPKACSFYGFTQEEMRKKKITDFNILNSEQVFAEMALARSEQRNFFFFNTDCLMVKFVMWRSIVVLFGLMVRNYYFL